MTGYFSMLVPAPFVGRKWLFGSIMVLSFSASSIFAADTPDSSVGEPNMVKDEQCPPLLQFEFKRLGEEKREHLCQAYAGKLLLIVNTASKCAYTPQYDGLEKLYRDYRDVGLVVLGFPSNDFAGQEPGTEAQILDFCRLTYSVEFPMFEKVHAARPKADPFYQALAGAAEGQYPQWNFHKYLVAPDGRLLASFKSAVKPNDPKLLGLIRANLPMAPTD